MTELSSMKNRPIQRRISQFELVDETTSNRTSRVDRQAELSYSSVGEIHLLPARRSEGRSSGPNLNGLFRVFSHPSSKFSGFGDMMEDLRSFHQQFMDTSKSCNLTDEEAFENLYILFPTKSQASLFYHMHVRDKAPNLSEAFTMLYGRFVSQKRRDRLIQKCNGLYFSDFSAKPGATKHSALRELCNIAASIQSQHRLSYQDDQHLRDVLMNACKKEEWAHRLHADCWTSKKPYLKQFQLKKS